MRMEELKKTMKGVDIVQTTPFNRDGSLDLEGMRANTRWLLERTVGKDFVFTPLGSTGEFYAMSDDECKAVIKMVVDETKGKNVAIVGGVGRAGTQETVKMCKYAESVGADGIQVILPYYMVPTEAGMYEHYKTVAESVNIGIMVYNFPAVSGSWVTPSLMAKLSKIPNVIAVKENTPAMASFKAMRKAVDPKDAVVFSGLAEFFFSVQCLYGSAGIVSGPANFAPELSYSVYEASVTKDYDKMVKIVKSMDAFSTFGVKVSANHAPYTGAGGMGLGTLKAAMDIVGLRGGEVRLPLVGITADEKSELKDILKAMKVVG